MGKNIKDNGLLFDLEFFANTKSAELSLNKLIGLLNKVGKKYSWLGETMSESLGDSIKPLQKTVQASMGLGGRAKKDGTPDMRYEENQNYASNVVGVIKSQTESINNLILKMQHTTDLMVEKLSLSKQLALEIKRRYMETEEYSANIEQQATNSITRKLKQLEIDEKNKDALAKIAKKTRELNQYIRENSKTEQDITKEKEKQIAEQEKLNKKTVNQVSIITKIRKMFASVYIIKGFLVYLPIWLILVVSGLKT